MMKYERLTERNKDGVAVYKKKCNADDFYKNQFIAVERENEILDRLAEIEDKLEQGTLKDINYPCNVGDKVFVVRSATSDNKNFFISENTVSRLSVDIDKTINIVWLYIEFHQSMSVFEWNFDKVFLTREEAEAKLKELQG